MTKLSKAEQETWDRLTWVNSVDISALEYDAGNMVGEVLEGYLQDGTRMTEEQLIIYPTYCPDVIKALDDDWWSEHNDYYDDDINDAYYEDSDEYFEDQF